ncbi:MarR family winged helix-turn-helix transcriptional regulator [Paeniglutamicibacter terrestris]
MARPDHLNETTPAPQPIQDPASDTPEANTTGDLAAELRLAVMRAARRMRIESSSDAVSPGQYSVLAGLRSEERTIGELAAIERVSAPSMTRIVKGLLEAGLITRTVSAQDARRALVALTPAGTVAFNAARNQRTAWMAQRVEALDAADRATLARAAVLLQAMSAK